MRRRFLEYREDEHAQIYLLVAILLGGFIEGTIDIGAAASGLASPGLYTALAYLIAESESCT